MVIIAIFNQIIYYLFATNFAYTVCQRRFSVNTKLCQFHICRINFSFFITIGYVGGLIVPIINCKSSCFAGISMCNNVSLDFYPSFPYLAHIVSIKSNMRWLFGSHFTYTLQQNSLYVTNAATSTKNKDER